MALQFPGSRAPDRVDLVVPVSADQRPRSLLGVDRRCFSLACTAGLRDSPRLAAVGAHTPLVECSDSTPPWGG
ncbi:hypothetical protein [Nocardiopsis rhodophaea]|uniref:hypothetical protein n=1 Tax=Nocardiopsis rhodophaea TaxID=280238 RepID=UPI0031DD28D6